MKQINFLPAELRSKQIQHRTIPFLVLAVVAGAVTVLLPWFMLRQVEKSLTTQVGKQEIFLGLQPSNQQQAQGAITQRQITDLSGRIKVLDALASQEISWEKVFSVVQDSVPQDVTLTTYNISQGVTDINLKMGGTAPTNLSFASFVESLKGNSHFTKLVVDGFTYNAAKGTVAFSLTATIKPDAVRFQTAPASPSPSSSPSPSPTP
jgi:Tfp pilus assembly protein PilN